MFSIAYNSVLKMPLYVLILQGPIVAFINTTIGPLKKKILKGPLATFHEHHYRSWSYKGLSSVYETLL